MTGTVPMELIEPELPAVVSHVWHWFLALSGVRGSTGFGPAPIGYRDIADWSRLTGNAPTPHEVGLLRDLDAAFLRSGITPQARDSP